MARKRKNNIKTDVAEAINTDGANAINTKRTDFSIILPSRGRTKLLKALLDSIIITTSDISRVEVLIAVDTDDSATIMMLDKYCSSSEFVKYFIVERSNNFSRDYYNFLYGKSRGRWIMAINDDCVFETDGWDMIAYEALDGKDVVYGIVGDGVNASLRGESYSCWPLMGRGGVDRLGYYFPTRINTWGADIWASRLYKSVGKTIPVDIMVRHICHHNGTRQRDELNERVGNLAGVYSVEPLNTEITALGEVMACR